MSLTVFNEAMANIRMSPIVTISEEARKQAPVYYEKTGRNMILFQRGEIDFGTPRYITEAAKQALDAGKTKYPKSGGEDEMKDAVIEKLKHFNKAFGYSRENIVCTYGGQEALELSFKLFEGRKAAGFAPCWSCVLENFVPYARTNFIEVPLEGDFTIDFEELEKVISQVSLFYLNTPQNPTGKLFTQEEVERIVDLCRKYNVFLISDEAYEAITFEGKKHFSPSSLNYENMISAFTLSKTYAMTGWRLGYIVSRNKRVTELIKLGNYTQTAGVTTFLQSAAKEALSNHAESDRHIYEMTEEFQKRRDVLYEGMKNIKGIEVEKPDGAFYLFPNFTKLIPADLSGEDRKLYIYRKLMDSGIAAVYGSCFGHYFTDNMRFSFSTTPIEVINEGVERMKEIFR